MSRLDGIEWVVAEAFGPLHADDVAWLIARVRRLEEALKAAKRDHRLKLLPIFDYSELCAADESAEAIAARERFHGRSGPCDERCGADAHNVAIDTALAEINIL